MPSSPLTSTVESGAVRRELDGCHNGHRLAVMDDTDE
jgi:hypothetical protein